MSQAKVLVGGGGARVDKVARVLREADHQVDVVPPDPSTILGEARTGDADLLFLDIAIPGGGVALLTRVKAARPSLLVVLVGAGVPADGVVAGFRAGAYDYLLEPLDPGSVRELAARAARLRRKGDRRRRLSEELERERRRLKELEQRLQSHDPFERIVGTSDAMRNLADSLREIARTDSTVLLTGESGTGKGLAARAIHDASVRSGSPFVEANCVVYSEGVLHSELFGHERGAFTGADRRKKGRFELAAGGTLFLDEIGEISAATQLMLLRVLQERSFERVGGEETLDADVRLIAATNRDLHDAMRRGEFRSDLFFRLNVIPVQLPPLRRHAEDVPVLATHFLRRRAERTGRGIEGFTPAALDALTRYRWPGNIRELENVVERMVVLCRGETLGVEDLPPVVREDVRSKVIVPTAGTLEDLERRRIAEVLEQTGGNKKAAASRLGIHRSTLYAKLRRHRLLDEHASSECSDSRHGVSESTTEPLTVRATGT